MLRDSRAIAACLLVAATSILAASEVSADSVPVELFARKADFTQLKMSPDGKYVAALVPDEVNSSVGIIRVADRKLVGQLRMQADTHISNFWWAKDNRIIASLATQLGVLDTPRGTGELVAIDADGGSYRYLFGYHGSEEQLGSRLQNSTKQYAAATLIDPLIDDPLEVLISVRAFSSLHDQVEKVYRLNVYSGAKRELFAAPSTGATYFYTDGKGEVRYATTYHDGDLYGQAYERLPETNGWRAYQLPGGQAASVKPIKVSKDGSSVYLASEEVSSRSCLIQHFLATGERRKLACDESGSLDRVINGFSINADPIAAVFSAGRPDTTLLDSKSTDVDLLKMLMQAFPGKQVIPTSVTRDGEIALILVYDDRSPGDYYFFNTHTHKAEYFLGQRQWLDPELMAERRPIHLKARDGTPLWGYLTLPSGVDPKNLPLVVNPHGGPYQVRDHWGFDLEPQLLASRGYAVLQVNFRGSSGYGSRFVEAGRKAWGTTMIDDITDATRWTISQGYADPQRICIFGGSYGGYAALMSAVREPDLYRCVVGYAGVYDLKLLKRDTDFTRLPSGRDYFSEAIAGSDEEMTAQSPITYLDRLKASVMIVHGEADRRAPFTQAAALRDALDARKIHYEWLTRPGEGHGFWKTENKLAFYTGMLAFLDRNIGKPATTGHASVPAISAQLQAAAADKAESASPH